MLLLLQFYIFIILSFHNLHYPSYLNFGYQDKSEIIKLIIEFVLLLINTQKKIFNCK